MGKKRHHEFTEQSPDHTPKKSKSACVSSIPYFTSEGAELCQAHEQHQGSYSNWGNVASNPFSNPGSEHRPPENSSEPSNLIKALNYLPLSPIAFSQSSPQQSSQPSAPPGYRAYNGHPSTLPPLPPVKDKNIESVPFTHPASLQGHSSTKVAISYDRLEFLGDAYIELIASRLLFPRFPKLSAGRLSQQREMLVKNETLAEYALAYGFDERAKLPGSMRRGGIDSTKVWTKTMGDIFEAYVAAVILSDPEHGFQSVEAWLSSLWEHKVSTQPNTDTQTIDPNAKTQLATKVLGKGIKLKYQDEGPPEELRKEGKLIFHIGVYLTGWGWDHARLGRGKGLNKQEAGANAAADAMTNPLTAQVASVKRDYDANRWLERKIQPAEDGKDPKVEQEDSGT